jgi:hypothetical protein
MYSQVLFCRRDVIRIVGRRVFESRVSSVIGLLRVLRQDNIVFELHSQASSLPLLYNEQLLFGRSSGLIELRFHLPCQNHYP